MQAGGGDGVQSFLIVFIPRSCAFLFRKLGFILSEVKDITPPDPRSVSARSSPLYPPLSALWAHCTTLGSASRS